MTDFLNFEEVAVIPARKTKYFEVSSTHSGDILGHIEWDTGWRRYVMVFDQECKWSIECMAQCYKFVAKLMQDRKIVDVDMP